jgi:putative ABC transport system permease protein
MARPKAGADQRPNCIGDPMTRLWLRWSWRDLRARWLQVAAIAFIIALGTGVYTGLSSQNRWRQSSYDASYEALAVHDFLVTTAEGSFVEQGRLRAAIDALDDSTQVVAAEERLEVATQVDASTLAGEPVLVPGRVVGVDVQGDEDGPGPRIDRLELVAGRSLAPDDEGQPHVLLDSHFADHFGLPDQGVITLSTGEVDYVGTGYSPEYFIVGGTTGSFLGEAGFAVMFAPLGTAQALSGNPVSVNQLVLRTAEDVDPLTFRTDLETALAETLPDAATAVEWIEENRQYRRLYDDIEGDQRLFNIFAGLILTGAAFAAFNLTGRIVEAQRREIGVGMSLGVDRWKLAVRPLLVAFQISLLGVIFGIGVGQYMGSLMSDLNVAFVPLPVWDDAFQPAVFLRGASLGLALTFAATIWPVARAVRVDPVDAIRTGPRTTGDASHSTQRRLRLPGSSIVQFPLRNTVRAPRRTALTAFGIAAVITVLIAMVGMIDSMLATVDQGTNEVLADSPERVDATLDFFYASDDTRVSSLGEVDGVASAEPGLRLGGWLVPDDSEDDDIESLISLVDLQSPNWRPSLLEGALESEEPAVVISRKAADDLGVGVGDPVTLRHPRREGLGYAFVESDVPVRAIHGNPYRFILYMDTDDADLFGLAGIVNMASVVPRSGTTSDDLKMSLFGRPGVAAVESVGDVVQNIEDAINEFLGIFYLVQAAILLLAVLIAFNSTSISADERRREHATMFAFGLPVRTVLALAVAESAIIGALGTLMGVAAGRLLLQWLIQVLIPQTVPDIAIVVDVAPSTYVIAAVLGTVAVALAPVLTIRRFRRMDIPATLRVVE